MKILWFTNTPSLYKKQKKGYNGGGWIESLEKLISSNEDLELAISFFHNDDCFKTTINETTYYPISLYNTKLKKLKHYLFYNNYDYIEVDEYMKIINDFKPDIIHIFGTERSFGLITTRLNIPVIIHLQGLLNPYINALFAPGTNKLDYHTINILNPLHIYQKLKNYSFFSHNAKREEVILKNCKYYMGRTEWDKNVISLYAPKANYFYCSEVLREQFYKAVPWTKHNHKKFTITSTISKTTYKGFDLILKTAKLLKQHANFDIEWKVFGISEYHSWEKILGINCDKVNVCLQGIADAETLIKNMRESDLFIHTSYIDNSPNSLCEAQLLGLPVISTNVGGISSLIENYKTGILIPSNDPFTLASKIIELYKSNNKSIELGRNARIFALKRHDVNKIESALLSIYKELSYAKVNSNNI